MGLHAFSDGMPLGKYLPFLFLLNFFFFYLKEKKIKFAIFLKFHLLKLLQLLLKWKVTRLKGKFQTLFLLFLLRNIRKSVQYITFFFNNKKIKIQKSEDSLSKHILFISSDQDKGSNLLKTNSESFEAEKKEIQKLRPTKKPGVYMIHCLANDKRYYGETSNISGRLASHRSTLRRKIHSNSQLQHDWNTYSEDQFHFIPLFVGEKWIERKTRLQKELSLILANVDICYNDIYWYDKSENHNPFANRKHTEETKQKIALANSRPNNVLGKSIQLNGVSYPSLAEASRQTGIARKTIRNYLNDPNNLSCTLIE